MGIPEWFAGISEGASALQAALSDPDQALTFVKDAVDLADAILPGDGLTVPLGPFEIEIESVEGEKDWLEPTAPGSNWYADISGEPPSPFDCERWPNSPFCQSVLDTVKNGWFGIGVSISISENEICINPTFTFAFISMPMGNFCYRRTQEEPEPEPENSEDQHGPICTGCLRPTRKPALWGLYDYTRSYWVVESIPFFDRMTNTCTMGHPHFRGLDYVGTGTFGGVCPPAAGLPLRRIIQGDFDLKDPDNQIRYQYWVTDFPPRRFSNSVAIVFDKYANVIRDPSREYGVFPVSTRTSRGGHDQLDSYIQYFWKASDDQADRVAAIRVSHWYANKLKVHSHPCTGTYWNGYRDVPYYCGEQKTYGTESVRRVAAPAVVATGDRRRPEPPPLEDRRPEDMGCCPETQDQLQWLIKKMGLNRLPVAATESITADEERTIRLDSLVDLVHYGTKSTLEVLGEWPVKIEIRTDEGEESGEIKLPNVAETLAELFGLEFGTSRDADAAYAAAIAGLGVSSSILSTLISTLDRVEALSEFVGGRVKPVTREFELPFDPFADPDTTSQQKLFTKTTVRTEGWENDDKQVLATVVSEIREQIKLLEAVFVERGRPDQMINRLQKLADLAKGVVSASERQEQDKSWRQSVTELETQINAYLEANGMQKVKLNIKGQMTDVEKEEPKP